MRRPVRRKPQAGGMSLFPFLAVLICTMGSLVVVLLAVVQQAKMTAAAAADDARQSGNSSAVQQQLAARRDQIASLHAQRDDFASRLAQRQRQLGNIENNFQQLRERVEQLRKAQAELANQKPIRSRDEKTSRAELAYLGQLIAAAEDDLEKAKHDAKSKKRTYSIIPYDGPQGTPRRPIYLECVADRVIIQPEGIELTISDLEPPYTAGNPLASALRAYRTFMTSAGVLHGEPYPLLVVRPDGSEMYAAARTAMKSWDSEFGYELVSANLELDYAKPNPELAERLKFTIDTMRRQRERFNVASSVRQDNSRSRPALHLNPRTGTFEPEDGGEGGFGQGSNASQQNARQQQGERYAQSGTGPGSSAFSEGRVGQRNPGIVTNSFYNPDINASQVARGDGTGNPGTAQGDRQTHSQGGSAQHGSSATQGRPQTGTPGQPASQSSSNGGGSPREGSQHGSQQQGTSSQAGSPGQASDRQGQQGGSNQQIANARGGNWALPNAAGGSIGFTRPIRVDCFDDRLVIVPERGTTSPQVIVSTQGAGRAWIDHFVSAVWQHMKTWGIAGRSAYWKPILNVRVMPGGETRFAELEAMLQRSGIDAKKVSP